MTTSVSPNTTNSAATDQSAVPSMESIAAKMTAMRDQTQRNLIRQQTEQTATGEETPVNPEQDSEVVDTGDNNVDAADHEVNAQDSVSNNTNDSTSDELIDFIEFANDNPNAKFKFVRNGKEVVIDAKKAAAILGQGSAIHEEARQLKVERAEFDEYLRESQARQEGLALAMEFTIEPKLQKAYDEIVRVQGYQTTFQSQLNGTKDPAQRARIQASMQQNEQYIRQQQELIGQIRPNVEQFRAIRSQQVAERLESARKSFQDKELKNEYVFKEIREKVTKIWPQASQEIIPGVPNIDLISSDEALLSLIRDGLKFRDKPTTKSAGASVAALTSRRGSSTNNRSGDDNIEKLRAQAKAGDKKAADNLLVARLQSIRGNRGR